MQAMLPEGFPIHQFNVNTGAVDMKGTLNQLIFVHIAAMFSQHDNKGLTKYMITSAFFSDLCQSKTTMLNFIPLTNIGK